MTPLPSPHHLQFHCLFITLLDDFQSQSSPLLQESHLCLVSALASHKIVYTIPYDLTISYLVLEDLSKLKTLFIYYFCPY